MNETAFQLKYSIHRFAIDTNFFTKAQQLPESPIAKRRMRSIKTLNPLGQHLVQPWWDLRAYRERPQPGTGKVQHATCVA
jgi:hypothetical protein